MRELPKTASGKKTFPQMSALAFQHKADLEALEAFKKVPMAATIMRKVNELWTEKLFYVKTIGDDLRRGPKQYPHIWEMYVEAAHFTHALVVDALATFFPQCGQNTASSATGPRQPGPAAAAASLLSASCPHRGQKRAP